MTFRAVTTPNMALPLFLQSKLSPMAQHPAPSENNDRFESDTQRIIHRHLSDPNHVITEEEIASVRVGMTPKPDAATAYAVQEAEDRAADRKVDSEQDLVPGAQKTTPWDTIEPL